MLGETNIVINSDKEKWVYGGYGIASDGAGSWNFGNEFIGNVISFGAGNSSSSDADNHKNKVNFVYKAYLMYLELLIFESIMLLINL